MNLRSLSDDALWQRTEALAAEERRVTLAVLYHLREIERRMLYAARGFSNLKDYCTQVLKYSETSAYRRIASMHLLKDVPELDEKFRSGEITLSNAAQAQTHFHQVKKQKNKAPSLEEKRELLSQIESLSSRSCERLLGELRGDTAPAERSRPINATETEYSFTIDRETEELLKEIQRELHRTLSMRELVKEMAGITLKTLQGKRARSEKRGNRLETNVLEEKTDVAFLTAPTKTKSSRSAKPTPEPIEHRSNRPESISPVKSRTGNYLGSNAPAKNRKAVKASDAHSRQVENNRPHRTRYISISAEREVWNRAGARCQYIDLKTGRRCEGTRHLQIEHVHPHSLGGSNEPENLELLCSAHNRFRAVKLMGAAKMDRYVQAIRP